MYKHCIKRLFDIIVSFTALVFAFIPMAVVAILVKADSDGPVIFRQKRLGKDGKVFEMLKFRTMKTNSEFTGSGVYSNDSDSRVTKIGRILRKTSIDELPQLINILKGDMSLLGPRPPLTYHPWPYEQYTEEQRRMFDVRPGITGWAQINGRKDVEWHKRIELNVWYVDHVSLLLDIKIFFITILKVLRNDDNENKGETVSK